MGEAQQTTEPSMAKQHETRPESINSRRLHVAAAQIAPIIHQVAENVEIHLHYIREAKRQAADLIVFPELSLTGYDLMQTAPDVARRLDSEDVAAIAGASEGITSVFGMVELGFAAQLHNSSVAVRDGKILFVHRKMNLPNYGRLAEGKLFGAGRYIDTFDLKDPWHGSILTCSDAWNPGLAHLVAVKGATIMIIPINSAQGTIDHDLYSNPDGWQLVARFYSYIYGLPVVLVNRVGSEGEFAFWGGSKILGPFGDVHAQAGMEEELIMAELNFGEVMRARAALPTVRDSNLDLIHRETVRLWNSIGQLRFDNG
jgi:N-carbamoylputrescine amidase